MAPKFIDRIVSLLEDILNSSLSSYPKYPNKLQVSALIIYFKSFIFLPAAPVRWSSKKRALTSLKTQFRLKIFLLWVFLFDVLVGVVCPCVLLYLESGTVDGQETKYKMGIKTAAFQRLFLVGTFPSVLLSIFQWAMKADEISYDYQAVGQFANYLDNVCKLTEKKKLKQKIDIMGIMTHFNGQGYILTCIFMPLMSLYFKMDPMWYILHRLFPSCITSDANILDNISCKALFYGLRPFMTYAWVSNAGRTFGGSIIFAWIFLEMFNQCAVMLTNLKPGLGMHLYWAYWKVAAGPRYWSRVAFAISIYCGIWLVTICLYASIVVIPNANPLTFVYITFPMCGFVGIGAFCCLPYALKFPSETKNLIDNWGYEAGMRGHCFKGKVMRREVRAMQPVTVRVGNYFDLDKSIVVVVITAIVDETVNLVVSMSTL